MVKCPNGHPAPPSATFCGECGAEMTTVCVNGHEVPPGQAFCGDCGEPVVPPSEGGPGGRGHRARRWLILAGVLTVVAVAVVTTLVLANDDDSTESTATSATSAPPTTTSVPTTSTTTSVPTTIPDTELTLRSDGLGVADFGQPIEEALAALSATSLGASHPVDGGLDGPQGGTCPQPVAFLGLSLILTVGRDGTFSEYHYQGPESVGLTTPEGLGYGDSLDDVRSIYGDNVDEDHNQNQIGTDLTMSSGGGEIRGTNIDSFGVVSIGAGDGCQ